MGLFGFWVSFHLPLALFIVAGSDVGLLRFAMLSRYRCTHFEAAVTIARMPARIASGKSGPGGHDGGQVGVGLTDVVDHRRINRRTPMELC